MKVRIVFAGANPAPTDKRYANLWRFKAIEPGTQDPDITFISKSFASHYARAKGWKVVRD